MALGTFANPFVSMFSHLQYEDNNTYLMVVVLSIKLITAPVKHLAESLARNKGSYKYYLIFLLLLLEVNMILFI